MVYGQPLSPELQRKLEKKSEFLQDLENLLKKHNATIEPQYTRFGDSTDKLEIYIEPVWNEDNSELIDESVSFEIYSVSSLNFPQ